MDMGHLVLCLPVAHSELNPCIELPWASVKGYRAKHNKDYNLKGVERLVPLGGTYILLTYQEPNAL